MKARLGMGDATTGQSGMAIDIRDSSASHDLVPASGTLSIAGGEFYDPAETKHTSAANWVSNNVQTGPHTFSSHVIVRLITDSDGEVGGTATVIAHFELEEVGGGTNLAWKLAGGRPRLAGVGGLAG